MYEKYGGFVHLRDGLLNVSGDFVLAHYAGFFSPLSKLHAVVLIVSNPLFKQGFEFVFFVFTHFQILPVISVYS